MHLVNTGSFSGIGEAVLNGAADGFMVGGDNRSHSGRLGVRGFYDATEALLEEFHSSDDNSYKWAIGATIDNIKDKRYEDEYIKIINDKKNGTSRQMFVWLLGRLKSTKAIDSFINLLDDEDINGHIIVAMKYYKNKDLIPYIEPFLNHEKTWIRREAKKAISKLEK